MDFASSFVYVGRQAKSLSVDHVATPSKEASFTSSGSCKKKKAKAEDDEEAEATTNIVNVYLGRLQDKTCQASGDATRCSSCGGVFSKFSILTSADVVDEKGKESSETGSGEEEEDDREIWVCEYCGERNEVVLMEEEKPTEAEIDYIVEVPTERVAAKRPRYVFCIDISGIYFH